MKDLLMHLGIGALGGAGVGAYLWNWLLKKFPKLADKFLKNVSA